jgi:hypothetical protein
MMKTCIGRSGILAGMLAVWGLWPIGQVWPAEQGPWRAGVFTGSTSWAGVGYEKPLDEENSNAIVYTAGSLTGHDVEVAQAVRRYFLDTGLQPYVGLGLCELLGPIQGNVVLSLTGTGAAGLDWNIFDVYHCGVELVIHVALFNFPVTASSTVANIGFFDKTFTPFPGFYLRREF